MKRITWAVIIVYAVFGPAGPAAGGGIKTGTMNVNAVMVDKCGMNGDGQALEVECGRTGLNAVRLLGSDSGDGSDIAELLTEPTGTNQPSRPLSRATITSNPAAEQAALSSIPFEIKIDASTLSEAKKYDGFTEQYSVQVLKEDAAIRKQCGGSKAGDRMAGPTKVTVQF